jgi:hypothetical protein
LASSKVGTGIGTRLADYSARKPSSYPHALHSVSLHFSAQSRFSCQLSIVQSANDVEPGFFVVVVAELLHPPKSDHWKATRPLPASNRVVGGPNLSTTSDTGWPMYPSLCPAQYGAQAVRLSANNTLKSRAIS